MQQAVEKLLTASSAEDVFALAPEAATLVGFGRALFSRVDQGIWSTQYAHAVGDSEFGEQLVAFGTAHSRRLDGQLLESRCSSPEPPFWCVTPRPTQGLPQTGEVRLRHRLRGCAVHIWGHAIGMVHADRYPDRGISEIDRRLLGLYACGLGLAIERAQLADRLRVINEASASLGHRMDEHEPSGGAGAPGHGVVAVRRRPCPRPVVIARVGCAAQHRAGKDQRSDRRRVVPDREHGEGLRQAILRKLGASNRTEAAGLYHRFTRRAPVTCAGRHGLQRREAT